MSGVPPRRELFGREEQVGVIRSAVSRTEPGFRLVLLTGQAGIGKTAIWERGVVEAEELGHAVLQTRACEAEARLSHGGLSDLLEYLDADLLAGLAAPQRRAVDAALLRDESGPIDPRALGAGLLAIIRELAAAGPVLIAVDDDQWLDDASAAAVTYAIRRLRGEQVTVLLTRRTDRADVPYTDGLAPRLGSLRAPVETVEVEPLRPDAIRRLIDRPLPSRLARRVYELSGGNPLFALEIADALRRADQPIGPAAELPIPTSLRALVSARLAAASAGARRAVLVTSLVSNPRLGLIRQVLADDGNGEGESGEDGLEDAVATGLLVIQAEHVRLAHPLIGAVARADAQPSSCRQVHRLLADTISDIEEQVRHRALGTIPPDAAVADELLRVAEKTIDRGGVRAAAELSEQAWRFTPEADPRRDGRLVLAADRYMWAGQYEAGLALLAPQLPALPPGTLRAQARLRMSQMTDAKLSPQQYEEVLAEADPRLRAEVLSHRANSGVADGIVPVSQALLWTVEAVEISAGLDDRASHARAVSEAAWMGALLGDDPEPRLAVLGPATLSDLALYDQGDRVRAVRAVWRGETARARRLLGDLQQLAREREEDTSVSIFTLHLFETAIRVGDWVEAARLRDELTDAVPALVACRIRASVAAGTGDRALATEALRQLGVLAAESRAGTVFWHLLEARRAAGQAALFDGDAEAAVALLSSVAADAAAGAFRDPGVFPVGPDLVEALVRTGRLDDAREALQRLDETADALEHPWARAGVARARGILLSASGIAAASGTAKAPPAGADDAAESALTDALTRYRDLGLPFDEARTIAALGTVRRRQRRFREARTLLQDAAERFESLGALGLARTTRADVTRVGGRTAADPAGGTGLTATEQQVVDLVMAGCTNRQAADRLFISISAVEAHLTRIYAKLGVTSRTQLVRNLSLPN
ncbi:helix-turn-helix transcriptional regulator [Hamadaea tsunoensis]|uniref:helix-turn-helix transcriptional regulator n=1 Tax=Hamadaea tsunoensis TaxID=53368 RepID=UPI00040265B1|nr:LuxR family transcriptional regulator [Hamadaea tsunoensis]